MGGFCCILTKASRMIRSFFGPSALSHKLSTVETAQAPDHAPFRADIAGLRAVAVIPVLLFHANVPFFSGGFTGVDIFFVISGFLITSTIAKDLAKNQFSLAEFYERRARRILPALGGVILFCLFVGREYLFAGTRESFANSLIWLSFFSSNLYFKQEFGYFDNDAITKPLLHTWSLSIEEQFYLFFPILFAFAWKYARKFVGRCVVGIALISFLASIRMIGVDRMGAFYFIQSRAWELALGALLACANQPATHFRLPAASRPIRQVVAFLGLLCILAPFYFYTKFTRFPGIAALPPCAGAFAIIWANTGSTTFVGKLLSIRPLTSIGAISYSLYLWHWPLLVFARLRNGEDLSVSANCLVLCISAVFACISYWLIETPARNRRFLPRRKQVLSLASAALVLVGVTGVYLTPHTTDSTIVEASVDQPADAPRSSGEPPRELPESSITQLLESPRQVNFTRSPKTSYWPILDGVHIYRNGDPAKSGILVLGDSVANQWVSGLEEFGSANDITFYLQAISNCVPLIDTYVPAVEQTYQLPNKLRNASFDKILDAVNVKHVILAGAWQSYISEAPQVSELFELHTVDKAATTVEQLREIVACQLEKTINFFNERGCKVWLMLEPPEYEFNVPLKLAAFVKADTPVSISYEPIEKEQQRREAAVTLISDVVMKFDSSEAGILDPFELFCSDGVCITVHDNRSLYYDTMHLSYYGSIFANKVFQVVADEIMKSRMLEAQSETDSIKAEGLSSQIGTSSTREILQKHYWSIVVSLALLSAWLLLSKSRQPNLISSVDSNPSA